MTALSRRTRRSRATIAPDLNRLLWSVPLLVGASLIVLGPEYENSLLVAGIGASLGAGALIVAARHPAMSVVVLVAGLPFANVVLAFLYKLGIPGPVFNPLRSWKELIVGGVILAGLRARRQRDDDSDLLEVLVVAYVVLVAAYVFVPQLALKPNFHELSERMVAGRNLTTFVVLFVGAYWCRFTADEVRRITGTVLVAGLAVAAIGIYESIASDSWNRFIIETIEYRVFEREVLDVFAPQPNSVITTALVAGRRLTRVGSVFFSPIVAGFGLVLPLAIGLERLVRLGARTSTGLRTALVGIGLLLTQTRSAILGGLVAILSTSRDWPGRLRQARVRLALLLVAATVFLTPIAASSGLTDRVSSAIEGSDRSSDTHFERTREGVEAVTTNPLGFGVGRNPRPAEYGGSISDTHLIPENYYLQVGLEVGVLGMGLFAAITVVTIRRLAGAARRRSSPEVAAIAGAMTGLAVGALLLQTWAPIPVSWMVWAVGGAALGLCNTSAAPDMSDPERSAARATMTL